MPAVEGTLNGSWYTEDDNLPKDENKARRRRRQGDGEGEVFVQSDSRFLHSADTSTASTDDARHDAYFAGTGTRKAVDDEDSDISSNNYEAELLGSDEDERHGLNSSASQNSHSLNKSVSVSSYEAKTFFSLFPAAVSKGAAAGTSSSSSVISSTASNSLDERSSAGSSTPSTLVSNDVSSPSKGIVTVRLNLDGKTSTMESVDFENLFVENSDESDDEDDDEVDSSEPVDTGRHQLSNFSLSSPLLGGKGGNNYTPSPPQARPSPSSAILSRSSHRRIVEAASVLESSSGGREVVEENSQSDDDDEVDSEFPSLIQTKQMFEDEINAMRQRLLGAVTSSLNSSSSSSSPPLSLNQSSEATKERKERANDVSNDVDEDSINSKEKKEEDDDDDDDDDNEEDDDDDAVDEEDEDSLDFLLDGAQSQSVSDYSSATPSVRKSKDSLTSPSSSLASTPSRKSRDEGYSYRRESSPDRKGESSLSRGNLSSLQNSQHRSLSSQLGETETEIEYNMGRGGGSPDATPTSTSLGLLVEDSIDTMDSDGQARGRKKISSPSKLETPSSFSVLSSSSLHSVEKDR